MTCTHEALSPYTRDGPGGPTQTTSRQDRFAQRLRGVLSRINARIRDAIIKRDLFGLRSEALVDDVPEGVFETDSRQVAMAGFLRWLRNQLDDEFLTVVGPDRNQFVRAAYAAGLRNVHSQLSDLDVSFERADVDDLLGRPIHRSSLQQLYTRVYSNLESVRDDVAQAVREELTEGFAEGHNPTRIARSLTDRVNSIGKWRATLIARSEIIDAHSTGSLSRIDEINRDADFDISTGHGEWDAAVGQERTCDFCRAVNGVDLRPSEMRGASVVYIPEGKVYRLKPAAHPGGRCNISIRVGGRIDEPLQDRLPSTVRLVT